MQKVELPGIAFEKIVAAIQTAIDPNALVNHNEVIVDRIGHSRQFDIVIRGSFAGQQMLGIIECKDIGRKVGTPEVDAFVTKANDVNANFKVVISRSGFSRPALEKCAHYGVQALSLIENDPTNRKFFIGTRWTADLTRWKRIFATLNFVDTPANPVDFRLEELKIDEKSVLDGYTNYLLINEKEFKETGFAYQTEFIFDTPRSIAVSPAVSYVCSGIIFQAERVCEKLQRIVGINGTGFFDWNAKRATFPPNTEISTDGVPMDFSQWQPRVEGIVRPSGFIDVHIEATAINFPEVQDALDLESL